MSKHEGHRNRLRRRFDENPDGLTANELLELALFSCTPRKNTNADAHKLTETLGSLSHIMSADKQDLAEIIGSKRAEVLSQMSALLRSFMADDIAHVPVTSRKLADELLLRSTFAINEPCIALLLLDENHVPISIDLCPINPSAISAYLASTPHNDFYMMMLGGSTRLS